MQTSRRFLFSFLTVFFFLPTLAHTFSLDTKHFFAVVGWADEIIDRCSTYYTVDESARTIKLVQQLGEDERQKIIAINRELAETIATLRRYAPEDDRYHEVQEIYLPLANEISHQLRTFVMQPLGVEDLDMADHVFRIGVPSVLVAGGVGILYAMRGCGLIPEQKFSSRIVWSAGGVMAALAILRNYWKSDQDHKGTDFAALGHHKLASITTQPLP